MTTLIENGRLVLEDGICERGAVLVRNNLIEAIYTGEWDATADKRIDAAGLYIAPGFIDTHIHGGGGYDVMDATPEALMEIARVHRLHGCTSFLPTTLTASKERIQAAVRNVLAYMRQPQDGTQYARALGVHLEGPCFSHAFKGAQNPAYLCEPSAALFDELGQGLGIVRRVSMAPELPGAFDAADCLAQQNICVSLAHSDADFDCVEAAAAHGFSHITHMFNGMSILKSPDFYCQAGAAIAGLCLGNMTAEIIADGKHMPRAMLQLLYKCKGADGMLLTTDATSPTCMPDGVYDLGGLPVTVTDDVAMLSDRSSFAGSVATCDRLVRFAYKECGIPLHEAVKMAGLNHARLLKLDKEIGSLQTGKRADIILFDDDIRVRHCAV